MRLSLVAAPVSVPVSIADASAHVEVIGTAHDVKLTAMIAAAVSHVDGPAGILGRALIEQEWVLSLDGFPCAGFEIPLAPLVSVTSVKYTDAAGVEQTLSPSLYVVDSASDPGFVTLAYGAAWPETRIVRNAVRVQFRAGYGATADKVPQAIRSAILLIVGDLFENREAAVVGVSRADNPAVSRLLFPFKRVRP